MTLNEPIIHDEQRYDINEIKYNDLWDFYKKHESTFWTPAEIDYADDIKDWQQLSDNERQYIETILAFFAGSDFIVNEHLSTNFIDKIKFVELQMYYRFQAMIEDIHSRTYADLIRNYVKDKKRQYILFNMLNKNEENNIEKFIDVKDKEIWDKSKKSILDKSNWAKKYIYKKSYDKDSEVDAFVRRLIVFSVVEGIFFSGSFCSIFWLKKRGMLKGLTYSNELISRDEGLHRDVACHIYKNYIVNKLDELEVINIIKDGVDLEKEFVSNALPVDLIGMNSKLMCQYIEYVADHLLINLIGKRYYYTENPFPWMTLISLESKGNFFETRVNAYAKAEIGEITFNSDF